MTSEQDEPGSLINSLEAPTYYIGNVSRLVKISRGRVSRYLSGYEYSYHRDNYYSKVHQPPVINPINKNMTYASFLDLIDLFFVKKFLDRGFSLQHIRRALDEARFYLGSPHFARSIFFTNGSEIFLKMPKNGFMISLLKSGQYAINQVVELLNEKIDFEKLTGLGYAERWYPMGKQGGVVIDPRVSFGRPTLVGRGVATQNIYDLFLGENKQIEPVSAWFDIPNREILNAVVFEQRLCA